MLTSDRINTEEDVRQIRLPESDKLDYKKVLGKRGDLCIDVSALANTVGGIIIVGIKEEKGVPKAWPGIEIPDGDPDKLKLKIDDIIYNGITPHPHVRIKPIPCGENPLKWFVVIEVPYGDDPLYMVTVKGVYRHYHRHDGRNVPMSPTEIRDVYEKKRTREAGLKEQLNAVLEDFKKSNEHYVYWVSIPLAPPGLILPIDDPDIKLMMDQLAQGLIDYTSAELGMDYYQYNRKDDATLRFYENGCVAYREKIPYRMHFKECVIGVTEYRNYTLGLLKGLITAYIGKYDFVPFRVFTGTLNAANAYLLKPGDPVGSKDIPRVEEDFGTETGFYLSEIYEDSNIATNKLMKRIYRRFGIEDFEAHCSR